MRFSIPRSPQVRPPLALLVIAVVCLSSLGKTALAEDEPWEQMFKKAQAVREEMGPLASLKFFERAIRMQSDQPQMYVARAKVHHELGGNEKALHDYSTAIALDPTNPSYFYDRGIFWSDMKSVADTDRDMKKALQLEPGYPDAMFYLIQHRLLKEKEFAKAIDACELIIKNHPNDKRGYYFRGTIRYKLEHYVNAEYDFGLAITLDREYASAYRYRALAKMHQSNLGGALSDLATAIALRPNYHQAMHDRALVLVKMGEFKKAKAHVDRAIKLSDEPPIDYLLTRGRLWHALSDSTSASEDFAEVMRREPGATHQVPAEYRQ